MTQNNEAGSLKSPASNAYPWNAVAAWFLGPQAENREVFNRLVLRSLNFYEDCRENSYPTDPCSITEKVKTSTGYCGEIENLEKNLLILNTELAGSTPFYSTRYQGHMVRETTMPAILGYLAGMMWNQNNVDSSVSPVTTQMEIEVGKHLCRLIQFSYIGDIFPWAHITSSGSVSNIEALWAARNLKFHGLAIQSCVIDWDADPLLKKGENMPVYVSELDKMVPLNKCTQWQLLNLDVDTACNLTVTLKEYCGLENTSLIDSALIKHSVASIGLANFMIKNELKSAPVLFCPGTSHYSYPKAATVLGLGFQSVIPLEVDCNCRVDMQMLKEKLKKHLELKIPIISMVAVIGSTEESAVDPIYEIFEMREEFKKQGLNFTIHADAAWGGYLLTTLCKSDCKQKEEENFEDDTSEGYVPQIPLSDYVTKQYKYIRFADTVTIDPHKSGFCQFPAGALAYRNGLMKEFIALKAPEVFHNDVSVGVYGLDGSKPGAAASGVLLAHRVLGLDKNGLGRILGQCQFGSKLFYCMWMTTAQDYDNFVCINFIDLPKDLNMTEKEAKMYIRNNILNKDNSFLAQDKKAMEFLKKVGTDTLINTLAVNPKGNTDTEVCNKLQDILFCEFSGRVDKLPKHVPLFLTKSVFEKDKYGAAFDQFKKRLGLNLLDCVHTLGFLRNTVMNPFQENRAYDYEISKLFRNTVLNSIGGLGGLYGDVAEHHSFVVSGKMIGEEGKVFLDYMPSFTNKSYQYNVVLTMKAANKKEMNKFKDYCKGKEKLICKTKNDVTMMNFLRNTPGPVPMDIFEMDSKCALLCTVDLVVDEVFRYEHLEDPKSSRFIDYPTCQKYFLYGDKSRAFISHVITKDKDFHQVVELDEIPHSVPEVILDLGVTISIPDIPGKPLYLGDQMICDPLQCDNYVIQFKSKKSIWCKTSIKFQKSTAKKYFDADYLNVPKETSNI